MPNARILLVDDHDMCLESPFDMPIMSGSDLFLCIEQVQPDIAGILMTGAASETRRLDATSAEALPALKKSNDLTKLPSFVESISPGAAEEAA